MTEKKPHNVPYSQHTKSHLISANNFEDRKIKPFKFDRTNIKKEKGSTNDFLNKKEEINTDLESDLINRNVINNVDKNVEKETKKGNHNIEKVDFINNKNNAFLIEEEIAEKIKTPNPILDPVKGVCNK